MKKENDITEQVKNLVGDIETDVKDAENAITKSVDEITAYAVKTIKDRLLPISSQRELKRIGINVGEMVKECVIDWNKAKIEITKNSETEINTAEELVEWNDKLVSIIQSKCESLIYTDNGIKFIELLINKKINLDSPSDGELMGNILSTFAIYLTQAIKEQFIQVQALSLGKMQLKLKEGARVLNSYTSKEYGSKN